MLLEQTLAESLLRSALLLWQICTLSTARTDACTSRNARLEIAQEPDLGVASRILVAEGSFIELLAFLAWQRRTWQSAVALRLQSWYLLAKWKDFTELERSFLLLYGIISKWWAQCLSRRCCPSALPRCQLPLPRLAHASPPRLAAAEEAARRRLLRHAAFGEWRLACLMQRQANQAGHRRRWEEKVVGQAADWRLHASCRRAALRSLAAWKRHLVQGRVRIAELERDELLRQLTRMKDDHDRSTCHVKALATMERSVGAALLARALEDEGLLGPN